MNYLSKPILKLSMAMLLLIVSRFTVAQYAVDINSGIRSGKIIYSNGQLDPNTLTRLFDGNTVDGFLYPSTTYQATFEFKNSVTLSQARAFTYNNMEFSLESAQTLADLNAKTGTYTSHFVNKAGSGLTWNTQSFAAKTAAFFRVTLKSTNVGELYLYELELITSSFAGLQICSSDEILVPGSTKQLYVKGKDNFTNEIKIAGVNFSSSNPSIATVNSNGVASAFATGSVNIAASFQGQTSTITFTSTTSATNVQADPKIVKIALVLEDFMDPVSKKPWNELFGWHDPSALAKEIEDSMERASNYTVDIQVVRTIHADQSFTTINGVQASYDTLFSRLSKIKAHTDSMHFYTTDYGLNPKAKYLLQYNYADMISHYSLCADFNSGLIQEVWYMGNPLTGLWESTVAGPSNLVFHVNSSPVYNTACNGLFTVMGFNTDVGYANGMHSFGHRMESVMSQVYGGWNANTAAPANDFEKFTMLDKNNPGNGHIGSIHFPVNAGSIPYIYGSSNEVVSRHANWYTYPYLGNATDTISCEAWSCTEGGYMSWWFNHIPRYKGINNERVLNDWWRYMFDFYGAKSAAASYPLVCKEGSPSTADLSGPDCGGINGSAAFEVSAVNRTNATGYSWWVNGSISSIQPVQGAPWKVNVTFGPWWTGGSICVGINYNGSPYYKSFCKNLSRCTAARTAYTDEFTSGITIYPNPSERAFTLAPQRSLETLEVLNAFGQEVYRSNGIGEGDALTLGEDWAAGLYMIRITYNDGREESTRVVKK